MISTKMLRKWLNKHRWQLRPPPPDPLYIDRLASQTGLTPITASLLYQRGFKDSESIDIFLNPGLRYLTPLEQWPGLMEAATLLASYIAAGKKIVVWGDYDVDGVTATALVLDFFSTKNLPITSMIPSRFDQGYGLDREGISALARDGIEVLITVDCGIADLEAVAHARQLGLQVIITDHHLPGKELPQANAILNPKLSPCPCADLAGVGMAFLLMAALNRILPAPPVDIRPFLDLVALGTIADVVPLVGENRTLVKNGLLFLKSSSRPGINALKKACSIDVNTAVGAGDVGFGLAPRINAAGRLASADLSLDLLMAKDRSKATTLANKLDKLNTERKKIEQTIVDQALEQTLLNGECQGLVLYDPTWHQGVIGIAASRIVEHSHRPTILLTRHGELLKGSGRSIPGIHLYECLKACEDLLEGFGGHPMAAGVSLYEKNIEAFKTRFAETIANQCTPEIINRPPVSLDAELAFRDITPALLTELEYMQPYGNGCPRPVFLSPPVRVIKEKIFGQNKHLALDLRDETSNVTLRSLAWRQAATYSETPLKDSTIRVAFTPKITIFRGLMSIELTVQHIFAP